ncbi:MAG: zinc-binding dehydrogenase [Actinomycetota bacterium]|nr:zinc-binding alcohol dehydrogenase [Acidimicrobiaceae bacterium]MEE2805781.1 zinc-binding dehydrogenase [Actinomycetota bacterium]
MDALLFSRKEARYVAAMAAARVKPGAGASVGPLKLTQLDPPVLPGPGWEHVTTRLAGICGSDLATIDGRASRYFEALASFPFIPGHEVVAQRADGSRVVLEPVLGPETRGEVPAWPGAGQADGNDYGHLTAGLLEPGLQTGSCASTGGGWSQMFAAHDSQLHVVDENLSDESAVMIEPTAAGIHAVLRGNVPDGGTVAVIGAGTMGLTAIAALRRYTKVDAVVVAARYPHQHQAARLLGADLTVVPDELGRAIRRAAGTRVVGSTLGSGVDVTIDAVGSSSSLTDAIGFTRPRGRVVLLGMPNQVDMNLTALWHRETELVGAYCYGTEHGHGDRHTFELAADMVGDLDLGQLVSEVFPLAEYQTAIEHAAQAGPRGLIKIAFDLREDAA